MKKIWDSSVGAGGDTECEVGKRKMASTNFIGEEASSAPGLDQEKPNLHSLLYSTYRTGELPLVQRGPWVTNLALCLLMDLLVLWVLGHFATFSLTCIMQAHIRS